MNEYRNILASLLTRAILAAAVLAIGFFVLIGVGGGFFPGVAEGLIGCAIVLVAAVIVAFPVARLLAEPCGSLFWPNKHYDRRQPMYSIPESKRAKGLYEEAIAGFEKIAMEYPGEIKPYIEMIDIAIVKLKDPERAKAIFQRGMLLLKRPEDQNALAGMYEAISTRLNARRGGK